MLGLLAYRDHRLGDADTHLQAAIAQRSRAGRMHANHAAILRKLGRLADAEAAARIALKLEPQRVGAHNNLGNILRDAGRYRRKRRLLSRGGPPGAGLRRCLGQSGLGTGTGGARAAGGASRPPGHRMRSNQRRCAQQSGSGADAPGPAGRSRGGAAPGAGPAADFALPHSNILFCLNYRPDVSAEEIFAEYRRWDRQHAVKLLPARPLRTRSIAGAAAARRLRFARFPSTCGRVVRRTAAGGA